MKNLFVRFVREEEGQDLIEYSLLAAFISIVAWSILVTIGTDVNAFTDHRTLVKAAADGSVLPVRAGGEAHRWIAACAQLALHAVSLDDSNLAGKSQCDRGMQAHRPIRQPRTAGRIWWSTRCSLRSSASPVGPC